MSRSKFWLLQLLIVVVYVTIGSAGHFFPPWPAWGHYIDAQAEGFRAGHLWALPAPQWGHWDYSRYKGHFYTYWGLYPALGLAAVKAIFRMNGEIADHVPTFSFLVVRAVAGGLFLLAIARRLPARPPALAVAAGVAAFALGSPTPFLLARAAVYESAISAGSCFVVLSLWLAFEGMFAARPSADRLLVASSVAAGLAGGSRASLLPAIALIMLMTAAARWRLDGGGWKRLVGVCAVVGAPVASLTFVHLLLNKLRFDEWLEFGLRYQNGRGATMGARFLPTNVLIYLFQRAELSCAFPYVFANWTRSRALAPSWVPFGAGYRDTEPVLGLVVTTPIVLFCCALAIWTATRPATKPAPDAWQDRLRWRWLWGVLLVGASVTVVPGLLVDSATMRYEGDFASCAALAGLLAGWRLLAVPTARWARRGLQGLFVALCLVTITMGVLPSYVGYFKQFERNNPELARSIKRHLDVCP